MLGSFDLQKAVDVLTSGPVFGACSAVTDVHVGSVLSSRDGGATIGS